MHEDNIESLWRVVMGSSADNCPMVFAKALAERAVLAEREACAKVCAEMVYTNAMPRAYAHAIRERSNVGVER